MTTKETSITEDEAAKLARRFAGVNRAKFARENKVPGGDSMVYQHMKNLRPMNLDQAMAYAAGFKCSLRDISPRLADQVERAVMGSAASIALPVPALTASGAVGQAVSIEQAVRVLAGALAASDDLSRELSASILKALTQDPSRIDELAAKLETILSPPKKNSHEFGAHRVA